MTRRHSWGISLARGADVDARTSSDITPLAQARSAAIARLLLDAGAEIEPEPVAYATPLTTACMRDDASFVKLLLERGASGTGAIASARHWKRHAPSPWSRSSSLPAPTPP